MSTHLIVPVHLLPSIFIMAFVNIFIRHDERNNKQPSDERQQRKSNSNNSKSVDEFYAGYSKG